MEEEYLHGGYHKRLDSLKIGKFKRPYIYTLNFIQENHHQLNANFIANVISTIMMESLSMTVANIQNEIKLHYKYKILYDKHKLQNRRCLSIYLVHMRSILKTYQGCCWQ